MAGVGLSSARALHDGIDRRIRDLREVQLPRLRTCTLATELAEWESELHATLHRIASLVSQLESERDEAESSDERAGLEAEVQEAQKSLTSLRIEARRALLAAHTATLSQQASAARAALLGRPTEREVRMPTDQRHATSDQLTAALQRTVALMSGELEKSGYSTQLLEESSETIAQVSAKYTSFNELLHNSIALVRQMERAELWDLGMLLASMAFFAACVLYILYVRLFSKGLWALSLTWKATGYMSSGAMGGASSLAALLSSAKPHASPPPPERDELAAWMPQGYRSEDVVFEDTHTVEMTEPPASLTSSSLAAWPGTTLSASHHEPPTPSVDSTPAAFESTEAPEPTVPNDDASAVPTELHEPPSVPALQGTPSLDEPATAESATSTVTRSHEIPRHSSRRARPWDDEL